MYFFPRSLSSNLVFPICIQYVFESGNYVLSSSMVIVNAPSLRVWHSMQGILHRLNKAALCMTYSQNHFLRHLTCLY